MSQKKTKDKTAAKKFKENVLRRGEAVKKGKDLPPGATHEIVEDKKGTQELRRRRFSIVPSRRS